MNMIFLQKEIIFIFVAIFIFAVSLSFAAIYLFFRKAKINIFSLRETVSNLKNSISNLHEKKTNIDKEIHTLIQEQKNLGSEIKEKKQALDNLRLEFEKKISEVREDERNYKKIVKNLKEEFDDLNIKTKKLQELQDKAKQIENKLSIWEKVKDEIDNDKKKLHDMQIKIDLYSRIDELTEYGFFEKPDYLYETSERYVVEIEKVRNKQKQFIKNKNIIVGPPSEAYDSKFFFIRKILDAQKLLVAKTFNIECDFLISKVSPANFERTLKRIENIANTLEKHMADLRYGLNNEYIALKMQECKLQYQNSLLKKQEAEEQRAIREQIREEQKAKKEYEREIMVAEKDEHMFLRMLERAKKEIAMATGEDLQKAELKIQHLEMQLAEATARAERAKSMAEQTKRGHVYIISNVGSFGENIYKIGLTRRLDPTERVKELGDASVPFGFDIHAMIAAEDAPALERALHIAFDDRRVNAVNMRKEFFKVSLEDIRAKTEEITGGHASFIMTMRADEYYQTKRLQKIQPR